MSGTRGERSDRLLIPRTLMMEIASEGETAFPHESCGVLVGGLRDGRRRVTEAVRAGNKWNGRPDRYRIDPEVLKLLLDAEATGGPRVVGFYHSHPDCDPVPSKTDLRIAWPWYHYLIISVWSGTAGEARAWELDPDTDRFLERDLQTLDQTSRV